MPHKILVKIIGSFFLSSILVIFGYTNPDLLPADIFLEDINIGGLTMQAAENKMKENFAEINFNYDNFSYSMTPKELGVIIDYQNSFRKLREKNIWQRIIMNFQEKHFYLEKKYDVLKMEQVFKDLNKLVSTPPQDASWIIKDEKLTAQQGNRGTEVDIQLLKSQIINKPLQKEYIIPLKTVEPKLTISDLNSMKPDTLLAQFTTEFVKNVNRTENIRTACETLKNTLLAPGEIFSFNKTVGPRERETGYLKAMVISGGEFVPGLGGGICQVSSTLYNTILLAGLEIIERHPHSLKINYVPLGRDATVSYGFLDFKFKNNTDGYLLLDYKIEGQNLTIYIYGNQQWLNSIEVIDIPHQVVKAINPPEKIIVNEELKAGEIKVLQRGSPGYIVNSYRIIEVNGEEKKEFLAEDYYRPLPKIIEKAAN